jgi:hypothetical protein
MVTSALCSKRKRKVEVTDVHICGQVQGTITEGLFLEKIDLKKMYEVLSEQIDVLRP